MSNSIAKQLKMSYYPQLDNMDMADVSNFLELNEEKHHIGCRNWVDKYHFQPLAAFTIAYSDKYIYVDFYVRGNNLRAVNHTNNSPVAEDSCVEFFLSIPESKEYWNFEFNCIGTVNASHRETRENPTRLTDCEIAQIKRFASCGTVPFEEKEGIHSWNLMIAIPFSLIGLDATNLPELIKGNFYKCGSKTSTPHLLSWSPIEYPKPDFHRPEFFGTIEFAK
jgi:hypothetical protein